MMPKSNNSGFILFLPLLFIAIVVLVISFADYKTMFKTDLSNQSVLSESSDSDDEDKNEDEDKSDDLNDIEDNEDDDSNEDESSQKQVEQESDDEVEDDSKLKIKIKSNKNEFEFESEGENVNVQSNFPLSVDPETNELTVTTQNGEKVVTILPDQAVSNMLKNRKITTVLNTSIKEDETGEIEYQVEGEDEEKLLGVFNVKIRKKFIISAQTGEEKSFEMDLFNKLLDLLAF